jgi:stage III sporulation protein AA
MDTEALIVSAINNILVQAGGTCVLSALADKFYTSHVGRLFVAGRYKMKPFLETRPSVWSVKAGGSKNVWTVTLIQAKPIPQSVVTKNEPSAKGEEELIQVISNIIRSNGGKCSLDVLAQKLYQTPPGTQLYSSGVRISSFIQRYPEEWQYYAPPGGGSGATVTLKKKVILNSTPPSMVKQNQLSSSIQTAVPQNNTEKEKQPVTVQPQTTPRAVAPLQVAPSRKELPYLLVEDLTQLQQAVNRLLLCSEVAVDCEFTQPEQRLSIIQFASPVIVVDMLAPSIASNKSIAFELLNRLMSSEKILKVFHGCGQDLKVLSSCGLELRNIADTQVMYGYYHNLVNKCSPVSYFSQMKPCLSLNALLEVYSLPTNDLKDDIDQRSWHKRPLDHRMLCYATADVTQLIELYNLIEEDIDNTAHVWWQNLIDDYIGTMSPGQYSEATTLQLGETYYLSFTHDDLQKTITPKRQLVLGSDCLPVTGSIHELDSMHLLLEVLPERVREFVTTLCQKKQLPLIEIVADEGRPLFLRFDNKEEYDADIIVNIKEFILALKKKLNPTQELLFSSDNRIGIPQTLHRISCIKNKIHEIVGLTYRVGRHVSGTTHIISDILGSLAPADDICPSLLVIGRPGTGKTTLLREISHTLSCVHKASVIIVDSSDEIAGASDVLHPSIGRARRMSVFERNRQHKVLIEAVQNHNPDVIIIDEIGTRKEVSAVRTISQRGVGLVGTAHGTTLSSLLSNPDLCDLVGGRKSVTLGDEEAKRRAKQKHMAIQKNVVEIAHDPPFYWMIELKGRNHYRIFQNLGKRVSEYLSSGKCVAEERWIDEDGMLRSKFDYYSKPTNTTFEDAILKEHR